MGTPEETLRGGGPIDTTDVIVVHGGERREFARAKTMVAVMRAVELTITSLDRGAAALEEIRAVLGRLLDAPALFRGQTLQRVIRLAQGLQQVRAERAESMAGIGVGSALCNTPDIERRNQLRDDGLLDVRRQVQHLDPAIQGCEEEGQGGQELNRQPLSLGESLTSTGGQIGRLGEPLQKRVQTSSKRAATPSTDWTCPC